MATDPRKRQKKLERRTAKRQDKKHQLVKKQQAGISEQLSAASRYPILDARIGEDLWSEGLGPVLLSRQLPDGSVAFAVFLVDRYCLGIKDAFGRITGHYTYETDVIRKMFSHSRTVSASTVRKLVEQAVAYAADLGLSAHPDYHKVKAIFGDINPTESPETFEFGKDGKPLFIAGPHDSPQRCREILAILSHTRGPGGFHYLIPYGDVEEFLPKSLQHGTIRRIGRDADGNITDEPIDFEGN